MLSMGFEGTFDLYEADICKSFEDMIWPWPNVAPRGFAFESKTDYLCLMNFIPDSFPLINAVKIVRRSFVKSDYFCLY